MLLRHTTGNISERKALTVNPAKTCQPVGAMYAALGINKCLPHSHGSQGCCAYHRSALTRHYKDPVMATTSSFTEGASVFGGQANLLESIQNIFAMYDPEIIAVHTTCLSEVIGDDMKQIIGKAEKAREAYRKRVQRRMTHAVSSKNKGRLEAMLASVADTYEDAARRSMKRFLSLLEPVVILAMGLLVGFIVFSIFLAVFRLNEVPF